MSLAGEHLSGPKKVHLGYAGRLSRTLHKMCFLVV